MIEIITYIPLDDRTNTKWSRTVGIKDNILKIAAVVDRFELDNNMAKSSLEEAYTKWFEWTCDNFILVKFEE